MSFSISQLSCGFLILSLLLVSCGQDLPVESSSTTSADGTVAESANSGPHPKLVIDEPLHQFGFMEVGTTIDHEFEIKNEGEAPLKLKKERSTCKCTMADFEEVEVAPGESYRVRLEWIGKVKDENFSQAAYISTNDPENPEIALTVSGVVEELLEFSPSGVWRLGQLNNKEPTTFTGYIKSNILESFEVGDVENENENLLITILPMNEEDLEKNEARSGYQIKGKVEPGMPIGEFKEKISFPVVIKEKSMTAVFDVQGYIPGPVQILGFSGWNSKFMSLEFGRFKASEGFPVKLTMFVKDNEHDPIEITEVISDPDIFEVSLSRDERFQGNNRERYELDINIPAGAPATQKTEKEPGSIVIKTNNPMLKTVKIRVTMLSY